MTSIERIRKRLALSQKQFAELASVNQSTVSRWERGDGEPSLSEIKRIIAGAEQPLQPEDFFSTEEAA